MAKRTAWQAYGDFFEENHATDSGDESRAGGDDREGDRFTECGVGHEPGGLRGAPQGAACEGGNDGVALWNPGSVPFPHRVDEKDRCRGHPDTHKVSEHVMKTLYRS